MQIDPTTIPPREVYNRMVSIIVPRPIAWVSTMSVDGVTNIAPFSFFTGITSLPPTLVFCVGNKRGGVPKDTAANILATKQFVINVVPFSYTEKMVQTSASYPPDVSEFTVVDLQTVPAVRVKPPRVKGVPVAIECELYKCIPIEASPGRVTSRMIIGQIKLFHIDDEVLDENNAIDPQKLDLVSRLGGPYYAKIGKPFSVPRPPKV